MMDLYRKKELLHNLSIKIEYKHKVFKRCNDPFMVLFLSAELGLLKSKYTTLLSQPTYEETDI